MLDVVWTRALSAADADDYDRFVGESASAHYAQMRRYARVATTTRPSVVRWFLARERSQVVGAALVLRSAALGVPLPVATVERGPVVAVPDDLERVGAALSRTAMSHGVGRIAVMPYWTDADADAASRALRRAGFHDVQRHDGAHANTTRLDLRSTTRADLLGPGHARLRRRHAQCERAGAVARRGSRADFDLHIKLTREMMRSQEKRARSQAYFVALWSALLEGGRHGALFVCEHGRRVVATVVALRQGEIVVYAQGATTAEPAGFSKSIPPLLGAIAWAKEEGCRFFDLGGIPADDDPDDKRRRIAHLKLDFAGARVRLVGEHARLF